MQQTAHGSTERPTSADTDRLDITVGPPDVTIHADDEILVTERDGRIDPERRQGFFDADTRLVSSYELELGAAPPVLVNSAATSSSAARYEFTNPELWSPGSVVPAHTVHLRLDRSLGHGVHEDYDVVNYGSEAIALRLTINVGSDFADVFDVKEGRPTTRGTVDEHWADDTLRREYASDSFHRALHLRVARSDSPPSRHGDAIAFEFELPPRRRWHTCLHWLPDATGSPGRGCHELVRKPADASADATPTAVPTTITTNDPAVTAVLARAAQDLVDLRLHAHDAAAAGSDDPAPWAFAAGAPWFVTLFGRDSLVTSLQTMVIDPRFALGTLRALAALQGDTDDAWRDLDPGKIAHEIRHGELAARDLVPQTPYYGTHDATALFVLTAATSYRWHGDRGALDALRTNVERALDWIDRHGDLDGDGLQEYRTRSRQGFYNQGWKDAGESIVHADGRVAELPIATCELQGYVVAAKRAWADVVEAVYGERRRALDLRSAASRLADELEARFWWDAEGTYYLGLDGAKRPIESVASNPGHLLWSRAVPGERAARVAERLVEPDMFTGWGVRTLSERHVAYNPFSYQRGCVWPHDNAILVAGLCAYGLHDTAARVVRAIFDAARCFEHLRLPEAFSGLARDDGGFPVQYLGANVPQAWASGAPIQIVAALLGVEPEAPGHRLRLTPRLPEWLTSLDVHALGVGRSTVDLAIRRRPDGTVSVDVTEASGPALRVHTSS